MKSPILLLVLAASVASCGPQVRTTMLSQRGPRVETGEISVYSSKVPACAYEEVALIAVEAGDFDFRTSESKAESLIAKLKERARELGGNAIVDLKDQPNGSDNRARLTGTVVRLSSDCRAHEQPRSLLPRD